MAGYVTIMQHHGFRIQIMSPATVDQLGYVVDHPEFIGRKFPLVQYAVDAIEDYLKGGE